MKRKIEFASHPANLALVRDFVREFLVTFTFTELEMDLIVLGIDEACTNIIRHVYNHEVDHLITLSCEKTQNGVRFRVRDFGSQHNLQNFKARPIEIVQPGGLGLHLIRKAFDQVDYNLQKKGTELVLAKHSTLPSAL